MVVELLLEPVEAVLEALLRGLPTALRWKRLRLIFAQTTTALTKTGREWVMDLIAARCATTRCRYTSYTAINANSRHASAADTIGCELVWTFSVPVKEQGKQSQLAVSGIPFPAYRHTVQSAVLA